MISVIRNDHNLELNDNNLSFKAIDSIIEIEKSVIEKNDILKNIFNLIVHMQSLLKMKEVIIRIFLIMG